MTQEKNTQIISFLPRLSDFVFLTVFFSALASGARMLGIDSDLGRHLTLGSYILNNRIIPTLDLFSHTLFNHSRPPYEWLSQVFLALADHWLGLDGAILLSAVVIAATFTLLFQFANRRSKSPILAFLLTLLAAGATSLHWLPRPHVVTFLLLTIWIEKLEQIWRGEPVRAFTFPLIMLLWANLHGGFVFGILAWFAYVAGWLWEKWHGKSNEQTGVTLLRAGVISLLATVITPNFWRNWEAVLNNRSTFILNRTVETMAPNLTDPAILPFTSLLVLTVIIFLVSRKTVSPGHFFLLAGLGFMSLSMTRNIPLFVVACTPILSEMGASLLLRSRTWRSIEERFTGLGKPSTGQIIPCLAVLCAVGYLAYRNFNEHRPIFQFSPQVFPVQALDWLESNPQSGNMFNEFNWGGYILYRTRPHQQVFLDSQSDFYGEPLIKEYEQMMNAQGDWTHRLEKYQVSWALIPPDKPLAKALQSELGWVPVYQDKVAVIFHKP